MNSNTDDKPPGEHNGLATNSRRWKTWHEREVPVKIEGQIHKRGVGINVLSRQFSSNLRLRYPQGIWEKFPKYNKDILLDNITHIFTAHLPFLLKGNIRLEYNTGYPHSFSWASQCFMRNLPAYWYSYKVKRGKGTQPLLKTLLNSRSFFARTPDYPPSFPSTKDKNVLIPFTFGKDSFITYRVAKEIGLNPILICYNDPMEEGDYPDYEDRHKKKLFKKFKKIIDDPLYYFDNPLGCLREPGEEGTFGYELLLTSWAILSIPIAYKYKAGYLIFSNERSVNDFFYDNEGLKIVPDYEQSAQATEELSILTQALSESEVYTTTFLQGLNDLGIIAILKHRYPDNTFKYLMSCWAEGEEAKNKRWCANCSKCARLYVYLVANGVDPIKEAGFKDNMFDLPRAHLYNVFGQKASGTGWDSFGLNTQEQALAFYLCYLRGNRDPLVMKFVNSNYFKKVQQEFSELVSEYYSLQEEHVSPLLWKKKIDRIFATTLDKARQEIYQLHEGQKSVKSRRYESKQSTSYATSTLV